MEKPSSSSSSDHGSEAAGRTTDVYNPCSIIEAVKSIVLKCLGGGDDFKSQENCRCSGTEQTIDPPPSTTTPTDPNVDPHTVDAAATSVSLAAPPRPGGSEGKGPKIN